MKDAKGHGSNKRGVHAGGIERIGKPLRLASNILTEIRANPGGFSLKPQDGAKPTGGYMVSLPGHTAIVRESDLSGPHAEKILAEFSKEHSTALSQKGAHIGGWTDKESGQTYLDISHNIKNKNAAVRAGRTRNQIAIWDVKKGREIRTGGTGK